MARYEHRTFRLPQNVNETGIESFFDGLNMAGWEIVWFVGTFAEPDKDVALLFRRRIRRRIRCLQYLVTIIDKLLNSGQFEKQGGV